MYTTSAENMYLEMRKPWVSPNGLGSAIQMQIFYHNRNKRRLPQERKDAIWKSVEYLRIELLHLRTMAGKVGVRNEEKLLEALQNELAYSLMRKEFKLGKQPAPVYPPPPPEKRIGGRNGFNGPYQP
jgi:hypothetical protein